MNWGLRLGDCNIGLGIELGLGYWNWELGLRIGDRGMGIVIGDWGLELEIWDLGLGIRIGDWYWELVFGICIRDLDLD